MTFKRDKICRENEEIIINVLREEGPMTIRDITKAVSGCEVGDSHYSIYARTVSGILGKLLKKGNIINDKSDRRKTVYRFKADLAAKSRPVRAMTEGEHIIHEFTVRINTEGLIDRITKDGAPVKVYIPEEVTGRGMRTIVELPISADRFRKGLSSGRFKTEVIG